MFILSRLFTGNNCFFITFGRDKTPFIAVLVIRRKLENLKTMALIDLKKCII